MKENSITNSPHLNFLNKLLNGAIKIPETHTNTVKGLGDKNKFTMLSDSFISSSCTSYNLEKWANTGKELLHCHIIFGDTKTRIIVTQSQKCFFLKALVGKR
ncbi:MAG: hypothetical protein HC905_30945 [Bacteroidales bacterium]|nr:hypothetical protein [Bacteroidales bacterium]